MTLLGRSANVLTYAVVRAIVYFITDPAFVQLRCGACARAGYHHTAYVLKSTAIVGQQSAWLSSAS